MNKHTILFLFTLLTFWISSIEAAKLQNVKSGDWADKSRYESKNQDLINQMGDKRIKTIFIGNSITEGWVTASPEFFSTNNYIGRGISGQVTEQFLERFSDDVISLHPQVVVINGGINDIAENLGRYNEAETLDNIKQMAQEARASDIKVVLTSVLPASKIPWRDIENTSQKVISLNEKIREYAEANDIPYVDYYSRMSNKDGGLIDVYTTDGVHVTTLGYKVMQDVIKAAIDKLVVDM